MKKMKKYLSLVTIVVCVMTMLFAVGCGGESSDNADGDTVYVTGTENGIGMYSEADENSEKIATLQCGKQVILKEEKSDFSYVYSKYDDQYGYVKTVYLTDEQEAVCKGETYYIKSKTGLYKGETDDSAVEKQLKKGSKIKVIAKLSGSMWRVQIPDTSTFGYVSSDCLSKEKVSASSDESKPTGKGTPPKNYSVYYAYVDTGFLALRSKRNDSNDNIIGKMYTGDMVYVVKAEGLYWYCYSPDLEMYGYVNSGYLVDYDAGYDYGYTGVEWYVSVSSGYLALRSEDNASDSNIIGKLYNGDYVYLVAAEGAYWYVYSPSLDMYGYVNSNYLY